VPVAALQYHGYRTFCIGAAADAASSSAQAVLQQPWCNARWPSVYAYVQDRYWGVGFLRYFTISQAGSLVRHSRTGHMHQCIAQMLLI
jgi:phosphatidylinositol glycan class V